MRTYVLQTPYGPTTSAAPGQFAGWRTGKIYGRLDCASGKRMKRENRVFFEDRAAAEACGYRPCKKCKP